MRGGNKGTILAALLANYSSTHPDVSLSQLFASRKSRFKSKNPQYKNRAPVTRMKIFWELATASLPLRKQDLLDAIHDVPGALEQHLHELDTMSIINYKTVKKGKPISLYKLAPNHPVDTPSPYRTRPNLTIFVYETLLDAPNKEWTLAQLAQLYLQQRAGTSRRQLNEWTLASAISNICSHFMKNGYVEREEFTTDKKTTISLSLKQRQNLVDLVTLLDAFQRQDPEILARGRALVQSFRDHPDQVAALMKKARENSRDANKQPMEDTDKFINPIIALQPGLTMNELQEILIQHNRRFSIPHIARILRESNYPFKVVRGVRYFYPHTTPPNKPVSEQRQDVA